MRRFSYGATRRSTEFDTFYTFLVREADGPSGSGRVCTRGRTDHKSDRRGLRHRSRRNRRVAANFASLSRRDELGRPANQAIALFSARARQKRRVDRRRSHDDVGRDHRQGADCEAVDHPQAGGYGLHSPQRCGLAEEVGRRENRGRGQPIASSIRRLRPPPRRATQPRPC